MTRNPREASGGSMRRIFGVALQNALGNRSKGLLFIRSGAELSLELLASSGAAALAVQDGPIEVVLVREVAEHDGLVDAGPLGDLAGGGAAKALPGEQMSGHREDLPATIGCGEAIGLAWHVSMHLLCSAFFGACQPKGSFAGMRRDGSGGVDTSADWRSLTPSVARVAPRPSQ